MKNRMMWFMVALLLGFMGLQSSYAQGFVNILPNGGFENGQIGPYGVYGNGTSEVVTNCVGAAVPEGPAEGTYCLHVVVAAAGANNWDVGMSDGSYTFEQGKKYTFSAFVKSKSGTVQFRLKPERAADPWEGFGDQVFTATDTWQEYYVTTPVFAATVTPASPTFHFAFTAGDFWIDGVRLYEGDYVPPVSLVAHDPDPPDGGAHAETWASLSWQPGLNAVTHDVYFGTSFDDVDAGAANVSYGNQPDTFFIVGFPGTSYSDPLVPGTTYYWRVDEVNQASPDSPWRGKVWSFLVPPVKAYAPSPADTAKFIDTKVTLTWKAGLGARIHQIYFGDDAAAVDAGTGGTAKGPAGAATYSPSGLQPGKTYYWRIDEFDGATTHKGDIWKFTTAGTTGGVRADYYRGMNFETFVLTRTDPQINFNWGDPGGPDPAVGNDNFSVRWTGEVEAAFTETYTFYTNSDDGARLWVDGQPLVDAWVDQAATENYGKIDLIAGNTYSLVMEYYENGGGAVAELRWSSPRTPKQIVPQAALSLPVKASSPTPRSGSVDVKQTIVLTWGAGDDAASHEVYFGTDADAVKNATKSSPEYKGTRALGNESYDPGKLAWSTTYYWRVDEVNNANASSPWVGNLWSFTTADFLIVDDFESYNDIDPPAAGSNRIFDSWIDGYGTTANGALVGNEFPPYAERTVIHGGEQSMPFVYDNNHKYSEATMTLVSPRDWTEEGVSELSLWFRGMPGSVGSFVESPAGTYTMTASGADITGTSDQFHYAYKMLSGAGSIIAKVDSLQNTNNWAKAGVMIRDTLDPSSAHAMVFVTPANGIVFEYRPYAGGDNVGAASQQTGLTAPQWVKIERDIGGTFTASYSSDGVTWKLLGTNPSTNIQMTSPSIYIGLALTAHNVNATCKAVFSNVTVTGTGTAGPWVNQDVGITSNAAERLYVTVANATGTPAVVYHDNPNAAQIDAWNRWVIPLKKFADQGINLTNVNKLAIGLGTPGNTTAAGGSGKMYFDDIRVQRAATAANMLVNGGFEDGILDPWYIYDNTGSGATADVVTDNPVEGNACLHVVLPAGGANFWDVGISQPGYVFQAGKSYTLSAFLKCKTGTMQINFKPEHSADPWEGYGEQVITMTDQWVEYSVTTPVFTKDVSPANATFHIGFAAGEFWMDGVRLYEGDYVPSPSK